MKITNIKTLISAVGHKNCIFVFVETDEGITGVGEAVLKRKSKMIEAGIHELTRFLIGKDPTCIEDLWEKMYRDSFWVGGPVHTTPLSAVEIALWDILGKSLNVPVYKLFGGPTRDKIAVYSHCATGASPEEFAVNAKACMETGHHAIKCGLPLYYGAHRKVKIAGGVESEAFGYYGTPGILDKSLKETELLPADSFKSTRDYMIAAREAVGPSVHIMIDCHGRLSPANARKLIEYLDGIDILFLEEPVPPENAEALREVSANSPIPIATGERWSTIYDARRFIENDAIAVAQPDVVNCGGLMQAKKIAALAEAHYITIAPHNPNGPVATAASLHFAASIPNFLILESVGSARDQTIQNEVSDPPLRYEGGYMLLPEGPGLGIELKLEECLKHPYQPFEGWR